MSLLYNCYCERIEHFSHVVRYPCATAYTPTAIFDYFTILPSSCGVTISTLYDSCSRVCIMYDADGEEIGREEFTGKLHIEHARYICLVSFGNRKVTCINMEITHEKHIHGHTQITSLYQNEDKIIMHTNMDADTFQQLMQSDSYTDSDSNLDHNFIMIVKLVILNNDYCEAIKFHQKTKVAYELSREYNRQDWKQLQLKFMD